MRQREKMSKSKGDAGGGIADVAAARMKMNAERRFYGVRREYNECGVCVCGMYMLCGIEFFLRCVRCRAVTNEWNNRSF